MAWEKKSLLFNTDHNCDWMVSHATVPTAIILPDESIRIYFAPRNEKGQSIPAFIDVDVTGEGDLQMKYLHTTPILPPGKTGTFDDSGIMPCSVSEVDGKIYLYYTGWNLAVTVPYRNSIGLAISIDGGYSFERLFDGPIVDRDREEPYFTLTPCVYHDGDDWHMWYGSGTGFVMINEKPEPLYVIKYASSADGIVWQRKNITCIHPKSGLESNARPAVIREQGIYKMWFAYRGSLDYRDGTDSYRIGYAESTDAKTWRRMDEAAGIDVSANGWDSTMITYPFVLPYKEKKYLFYNGNGFGRSGIGYAVWKDQ
ncbi:MAG: hypothetical protein Q8941_03900 [Bacteroidota bacterium]|nr:hypothetical protein [Bacteroidota bacterium]